MICRTYEVNTLKDYKYVVILSESNGQILLSRHKDRATWETQGGHIEPGETPLEAARRELYEESGAVEYEIAPLCDYWAGDSRTQEGAGGVVFQAVIHRLEPLPESEMAEVREFEYLPENLTYPAITPVLFARRARAEAVGIAGCSDGLPLEKQQEVRCLKRILAENGLYAVESPFLYRYHSLEAGTPAQRAEALMEFYRNPSIRIIFDISGGNLANQILDKLDFEEIRKSGKELWGYSDLTVLLNGIYAKTGNSAWLYQVRTLVWNDGERQRERFAGAVGKKNAAALLPDAWRFLQGDHMEGILLGGNIRCFLKLAGTPYFPDMTGKILFLESLGGGRGVIASLLAQLRQLGIFDQISGLLLGTFTELDGLEGTKTVEELVLKSLEGRTLPVARTMEVGHGAESAALHLGGKAACSREGFWQEA